jgi:membrane protein required for colicin V production
MGIYDMLVLGIVLATTFFGWRKGLATQIASIVSIAVSFFVAVRFREPVAAQIDAAEPWNRFAAMAILYLGSSLVIWTLFRQIRTSIEKMKLTEFDRQMGAIFGGLKGVALASVVTLFAFTLLQEPQRQAIIHSKSGVWIARVIHRASAIMPPEVRHSIEPYLQQLDQGFGTDPWRQQYARPEYPPTGPGGQPFDPWGSSPQRGSPPQPNSYSHGNRAGDEPYSANRSYGRPPSNYEYRPANP